MSKGLTPWVLFKAFNAPLGIVFLCLMIVIDAGFGMYMPRLNGQVLDTLTTIEDPMIPIRKILLYTGLGLVQYVMNVSTGYCITVLDRRMTLRLRSIWLKRVLSESIYIDGVYGGGKLVGMYGMQKAFESSVAQLLSSIKSVMNLTFVYYVVFWEYDQTITTLFLVQPLFAFVISKCTAPLKFRWSKELQEYGTENADHSTVVLSNLSQSAVKSQAVETHLYTRWRTLYQKQLFVQRVLGIGVPFVVMVWMLVTTMWMYFHCLYAIADGKMTLGGVVTLMQYKGMNQGAIFSFVGLYMKWQGLKSTWEVMGAPFRRDLEELKTEEVTLDRPDSGGWYLRHGSTVGFNINPLECHVIHEKNGVAGSRLLRLLLGCDEHGALTKGWSGKSDVVFQFLTFEPTETMMDVVDYTASSNLHQRMSLMRAMQGDMVLIDHTLDVFETDEANDLFDRLSEWCTLHQKTLVVASKFKFYNSRATIHTFEEGKETESKTFWNRLRRHSLFGRRSQTVDFSPNTQIKDTDTLLRRRVVSKV